MSTSATRRARLRRLAGLGIVWWAAVGLLGACSAAPTKDWASLLVPCPTDAEIGRLAAWDRLEIRVYDQAELTGEYEISPTGTINFPLLGELALAGLRCDEVERMLTSKLSETHLREPYVVCINREARRTAVTVDGQVRSPGVVEFKKGLMLTDAIAKCEGLAERAEANSVVITRKNEDGTTRSVVVPYEDIVTARAGNVCLHPGDLIYVPQRVF